MIVGLLHCRQWRFQHFHASRASYSLMKLLHVRLRTTLMAFALGLSAVYMWNGLSITSNEVAVDLPNVKSTDDVLVVFAADEQDVYPFGYAAQKRKAIGDRDLSLYDIGEYSDVCGWGSNAENDACHAKRHAAKRFIYDHLTNQRRGYIEIGLPCVDCAPVFHVFIEPDRKGRWSYVITLTTNGPGRTARGHSLKFRPPNSDEKERGYIDRILSFIDDGGKEVESF